MSLKKAMKLVTFGYAAVVTVKRVVKVARAVHRVVKFTRAAIPLVRPAGRLIRGL